MDASIFKAAAARAGIAGIAVAVLLFIFRDTIARTVFDVISPRDAFRIIFALIVFTFGTAAIGILVWLVTPNVPDRPVPTSIPYLITFLIVFLVVAATAAGLFAPASVTDPNPVPTPTSTLVPTAALPPTPAPVPTPTLTPAPIPAPAPKKAAKLCFGGGGGSNCLANADIKYDCNVYWGWNAQKWDDLAVSLCGAKDKMTKLQTQNNGGGGCGWTAYALTCN